MDKSLIPQAKKYIDYMSVGINPVTMQPIPKDDIVFNEKIINCFIFLSELLQEVMDGSRPSEIPSNLPKAKSNYKDTFDPSKIDLSLFEFSDEALNISSFVERLNKIRLDSMKRVKTTDITNWLVDIGLLKIGENEDGKKQKRITEMSNSVGITTEERVGKSGMIYQAVVYTKEAQQFIIDNLPAIFKE